MNNPLNETQYLLLCLAEECNEVAQRVIKSLRFGLDNIQPGQELDNTVRLNGELSDLKATLEMLNERCDLEHGEICFIPEKVQAKKEVLLRYMDYARERGTLQ